MRILILGGDADGNLGDRAIQASMCAELRRLHPGVGLVVVSHDPTRTGAALEAEAIPRGVAGLPRLCAAAVRADLVLCGGGGLFQDDDSLVKMPYWAARLLLVRLLGAPVIACSLGVGPLRAATSRIAARIALRLMRRISVRDPEAQRTAQSLTRRTVEVVPDPALLLEPADDDAARRLLMDQGVPVDGPPLVGVAARRFFPARPRVIPNFVRSKWRPIDLDGSADARRLVALLAETLDRTAEDHGAHVVFMPTYTLAHEGDDRVADLVRERMTCDRTHVLRIDDPALYKAVTRRLSVLLGGRMHPTIFASSVGTPVVGLAYNQKFHGFFELLGRSESVIDIERFIDAGCSSRLGELLDAGLAGDPGLAARADELAERVRAFLAEIVEGSA